jgi:putative drug exporter of the RND superfamily
MVSLARWCFTHRERVVALWPLVLIVALGASPPGRQRLQLQLQPAQHDSQAAKSLLSENFPSASREGDEIVLRATGGSTVRAASARTAVTAALDAVAKVPGCSGRRQPIQSRRGRSDQP